MYAPNIKEQAILDAQQIINAMADYIRAICREDITYIQNDLLRASNGINELLRKENKLCGLMTRKNEMKENITDNKSLAEAINSTTILGSKG